MNKKELAERRKEGDQELLNRERREIEELLLEFFGRQRSEIYANFDIRGKIVIKTSTRYKRNNGDDAISPIQSSARKLVSTYYKFGKDFTYRMMKEKRGCF